MAQEDLMLNLETLKFKKGRYKKVTLHNEDGDIHTKDIHFNQANIQNDNGDIQMKQLDPDIPLRIKNEEGDINLNYKKNFITPKSSL